MRLKPGTILTFLGALIVIVVGVLLTNQQATTPAATATPTAAGEGAGPLFPTIADAANQASIVRFEVQDVTAGTKIVMTKDATTNNWAVTESGVPGDQGTDQAKAVAAMSRLAGLNSTQSFALGDTALSSFGLDAPQYILILTDSTGATYTVRVGATNAATRRYYALVNDDTTTVYVINQSDIDNLKGQITAPPYLPTATPTVTPTSTPNPFSEVEQTATAVVEQTATMDAMMTVIAATLESTAEVTAEATAEAAAAASSTPQRLPAARRSRLLRPHPSLRPPPRCRQPRRLCPAIRRYRRPIRLCPAIRRYRRPIRSHPARLQHRCRQPRPAGQPIHPARRPRR